MIYVGIDNGLMGGLVAIQDSKIIFKQQMPIIKGDRSEYDIQEIIKFFSAIKSLDTKMVVVLEKAQVSPIAGKNSCFGMGFCFGMMQGILTAMEISYKVVHAKTWQKKVLMDINGEDTKQRSVLFCKRMFPNEDWKISERSSKMHDGLTDATCMAYYGMVDAPSMG
jgi:hypothetical protein